MSAGDEAALSGLHNVPFDFRIAPAFAASCYELFSVLWRFDPTFACFASATVRYDTLTVFPIALPSGLDFFACFTLIRPLVHPVCHCKPLEHNIVCIDVFKNWLFLKSARIEPRKLTQLLVRWGLSDVDPGQAIGHPMHGNLVGLPVLTLRLLMVFQTRSTDRTRRLMQFLVLE